MARKSKQKRLRITLKRSLIGLHKKNKATIRALGLRRINQTVLHKDNDAIRGMIRQVAPYVIVEEVESDV